MVSKPTGRSRGHPKRKPLLEDPDRHLIALIDAAMLLFGFAFEPAARLVLCMEDGPAGMTLEQAKKLKVAQRRAGKGWLGQAFARLPSPQIMDSRIDTLRLKLNRFVAESSEQAVRWRWNMRNAYTALWVGGPGAKQAILAFAGAAGERPYFEKLLAFLRDNRDDTAAE
jgi:hypothetical protein